MAAAMSGFWREPSYESLARIQSKARLRLDGIRKHTAGSEY
jgi:hypothetical protein